MKKLKDIFSKIKNILPKLKDVLPKLKDVLFLIIILFAVIIFILTLNLYLYQFHYNYAFIGTEIFANFFKDFNLPEDKGVWGTFGDYMGGVLNPIFAFLSFMALLYNIKLQLSQTKTIKEQQFEVTFFALLQEINSIKNNMQNSLNKQGVENHASIYIELLTEECNNTAYKTYKNEKEESNLLEEIKSIHRMVDMNIQEFQQFSLLVYQTLKLIDTQDNQYDYKKQYSNILRACIPFNLLQFLAINAYRPDINTFESYKELLEKFEFLEHMPFHFNGVIQFEKGHRLLFYIKDVYKESAFGKSEYVKRLNESLKTNNTNTDESHS